MGLNCSNIKISGISLKDFFIIRCTTTKKLFEKGSSYKNEKFWYDAGTNFGGWLKNNDAISFSYNFPVFFTVDF